MRPTTAACSRWPRRPVMRSAWIVVADAGYSNGEQAAACEAQGLIPHVPANRAVNNQGRWHPIGSHGFRVPASERHLWLPSGTCSGQAAAPQGSRGVLPGRCGKLWRVRAQAVLHGGATAIAEPASGRCGPAADAAAGDTGGDAAAAQHGRALLCHVEYRIFGHPRFLLRGLPEPEPKSAWRSWLTT